MFLMKLYFFSLQRNTRCMGLSKSSICWASMISLLDDRQIDYYNSEEQRNISKQNWMIECRMPGLKISGDDYWEKGTQSRKFKKHVVSFERIGCEIDKQGSFPKWVTSVDAALPIKRKWDNVPILNQYTKAYLEKECVDWLKIFREFANKELRNGCGSRRMTKQNIVIL
uniref:MHC class I-like antigen recognition-like domain-containing protein n=1 Tax=Sinocyclocheilus anshuiensis TaxID=1608454 RepID=A0A671NTJ6_9TELE